MFKNDDLIPREKHNNYSKSIVEKRVNWLKKKTNLQLSHMNQYSFRSEETEGNIENFIGIAQVPVGLAGPLKINGENANGSFYIPMATTEGALVASYNRGAKIVTNSGGADVTILNDNIFIGVLIDFNNFIEVIEFSKWIAKKFNKLKEIAESSTKYGKLKSIEKYPQGKRLLLTFNYTTGDAAGLNMITKATKVTIDYILQEIPIQSYLLPVTFIDKKESSLNLICGRGKTVSAEVIVSKEDVKKNLRTTPEIIVERSYANYLIGATKGGTNTYNMHIANGLAAIFVACGQDLAYVAESSTGSTIFDTTKDGDLYVCLHMPDLIIATVGGGTGFGTSKNFLEVLGCFGEGKVKKFAEIIVSILLAGEISMWGAIVSGEFPMSHERLGRNRPKKE